MSCLTNLVPNGSFEEAYPLSSSPVVVSDKDTIGGGWYNVYGTVDIMMNNSQDTRSPVSESLDGNLWIGLYGASTNREAVTLRR